MLGHSSSISPAHAPRVEMLGHLGMISLTNHDSRVRENSEVAIIYPAIGIMRRLGWWGCNMMQAA